MHEQLRRTIPPARLAPYLNACAGTTCDPMELYRWNSELSLALFDDV